MIDQQPQLDEFVPQLEAGGARIAVDTEADSLHCYFEKLCLVQLTFSEQDFLVDPLAPLDFQPFAAALGQKEIILQGADYDLRLLRKSMGFVARRVFDTVIAARLLGIREFSLAALVLRYFDVTLTKGSQKANWAQRPLPRKMAEYAANDTHYLIPLAEKLEAELRERGRFVWFEQSCQRALDQSAIDRVRDQDELWRITGSGKLGGLAGAVLRELWQWRDREAQAVDRPSFHILQNHLLLEASERFAAGETPEFRHFSSRRRAGFQDAARHALQLPEREWPVMRRRSGTRPTQEAERRAEDLKKRRDQVADQMNLDPSFIAPRATLDMIAADESRTETMLVPWQRELLAV